MSSMKELCKRALFAGPLVQRRVGSSMSPLRLCLYGTRHSNIVLTWHSPVTRLTLLGFALFPAVSRGPLALLSLLW